jgi:hypothetical protein
VTQYLVGVFCVADPKGMPGGLKLSAREVLDAGAKRMQLQLAQQPQLEASFSAVLGTIYQGLGENERAVALLERGPPAVEEFCRGPPPSSSINRIKVDCFDKCRVSANRRRPGDKSCFEHIEFQVHRVRRFAWRMAALELVQGVSRRLESLSRRIRLT